LPRESRVKAEKATLLSLAFISLSSGITLIAQDNLVTGLVLVGVGIVLISIREHFKFRHWQRMVGANSYWRGRTNEEWKKG